VAGAAAVLAAGATAAGAAVVTAAGAAAVVTAVLDPQLARVSTKPQPKIVARRIFMTDTVEVCREVVCSGRKEFRNCFADGAAKRPM
jgi:hypothetical protein